MPVPLPNGLVVNKGSTRRVRFSGDAGAVVAKAHRYPAVADLSRGVGATSCAHTASIPLSIPLWVAQAITFSFPTLDGKANHAWNQVATGFVIRNHAPGNTQRHSRVGQRQSITRAPSGKLMNWRRLARLFTRHTPEGIGSNFSAVRPDQRPAILPYPTATAEKATASSIFARAASSPINPARSTRSIFPLAQVISTALPAAGATALTFGSFIVLPLVLSIPA